MSNFFQKLLKKQSPALDRNPVRDPVRYELEKQISVSSDPAKRMKIARSRKTHQEILYYMAEHDTDAMIREAVARNLATPIVACGVIAQDNSVDVRLALAERLVRMLPELSQEAHSHLYAIAVRALGTLAMDEVLRVRVSLSAALKDNVFAPTEVVTQLALDVEREVSEPILRFCLALPDDVLKGILQTIPSSWAIEAIASRRALSDDVSAAVVETASQSGGVVLLKNKKLKISKKLINDIVTRSRQLPEWQEPLAFRRELSPEIALILSEFAHETVQKILMRRRDFDRRIRRDIGEAMKRRLIDPIATDPEKEIEAESPYKRAQNLMKQGKLDETMISESITTRENDFVIAALAVLAKTTPAEVSRVMALSSAKSVTALTWKAGLSMRLALQLQQTLGKVQPRDLLYPRNGSEYPLEPKDLNWQIEFLDLRQA